MMALPLIRDTSSHDSIITNWCTMVLVHMMALPLIGGTCSHMRALPLIGGSINLSYTLSDRIGKVVASNAEGCKVARSNPGCG